MDNVPPSPFRDEAFENRELNPYASPGVSPEAAAIAAPPRIPPFVDPQSRATATTVMFGITIVVTVAVLICDAGQLQLLEYVQSGGRVTDARIEANDSRIRIANLAQIAALLGTAIAFLAWFHRAHKNLPSLQVTSLAYSPGWAVGSFFIPILNWFRPCQIMMEVWKGSDPHRLDPRSPSADGSLVGAWWGFWIAKNLLATASSRLVDPTSIPSLIRWTIVDMIAAGISLVGAGLAILVVRRVTANQIKCHVLVTPGIARDGIALRDEDPFPGFGGD